MVNRAKLRARTYAAARAARHLNHQALAVCAAITAAGIILPSMWSALSPAVWLTPVGLLTGMIVIAWWWMWHVLPAQSTRAQIGRDHARAQLTGGVAHWLDIAELAGPTALRLRATILRPSLGGLTRKELRRLDPNQIGTLVATIGNGRLPGQQLWSSCEDAVLYDGGPRTGKTVALADKGNQAPGALITTSTRLDLAESVQWTRRNKPVHVIDLTGDLTSNVCWSVLAGCGDFMVAQERAANLVPKSDDTKSGDWVTKARFLLAVLLNAAAIGGHRHRDVLDWLSADSATSRHAERVISLLSSSGPGAAQRIAAYRNHLHLGTNTRTSVTGSMDSAFAWLNDNVARALGDADPEDVQFLDIESLILKGETLHIIGAETSEAMAPVISTIVAEIARVALRLARKSPNGRLDPPVTVLLDEAAVICPVPLDKWTSWFGGANINLFASVQSLAQLRSTWGKDAAGVILGNIGTRVTFGGGKDADDLADTAALTGEYRMRVVGDDHGGDAKGDGEKRGEHRWRKVTDPSDISALRPGQVLVSHHGLRPVIGQAPRVYDIPGWRKLPIPGDSRATTPWWEGTVQAPTRQPAASDRLTGAWARLGDLLTVALAASRRALGRIQTAAVTRLTSPTPVDDVDTAGDTEAAA